MYTLGIDIGSTTSKAVILKDKEELISQALVKAGTGTKGPMQVYQQVIERAQLKEEAITFRLATGYGRSNFTSCDGEMSELSCHGKGVFFCHPECRTIIDIGGQDAKVISLTEQGQIANFVMNDKCAAGTGRFLEVMAGILQLEVHELQEYAAKSMEAVKISSTCTVFAESEVISQLSKNVAVEDLIAGICNSVAVRVTSLAKRVGIKEQVFMSGGVAQNAGVRNALSRELRTEVRYAKEAQYMGAIGAAIAAFDKAQKL